MILGRKHEKHPITPMIEGHDERCDAPSPSHGCDGELVLKLKLLLVVMPVTLGLRTLTLSIISLVIGTRLVITLEIVRLKCG